MKAIKNHHFHNNSYSSQSFRYWALIDCSLVEIDKNHNSLERHGSEHTINGRPYPMELHFVHYNTKYPDIGESLSHEVIKLSFYWISQKIYMEDMKLISKFFPIFCVNLLAKFNCQWPQTTMHWHFFFLKQDGLAVIGVMFELSSSGSCFHEYYSNKKTPLLS